MRSYGSVDAVGAVLAALVGLTTLGTVQCGGATKEGETSSAGAAGSGGGNIDVAGAAGSSGNIDVAGAAGSGGGNIDGRGGASGSSGSSGVLVEGGAMEPSVPCENPVAVMVAGSDTGFDSCAAGFEHRRAAVACPSELPRVQGSPMCSMFAPDSGQSACTSDADCSVKPLGHCELSNSGLSGCRCVYGCTTDAECGAGRMCLCAKPAGSCVPTTCTTDVDCASGHLCASYERSVGTGEPIPAHCPQLAFSCQPSVNSCTGPACCGIGRPFIVAGIDRRGSSTARADWLTTDVHPDTSTLDAELRAHLALGWTQAALMEHASIAAFARFAMQLLQLGAPADLVIATQQAMADETEHAKMCFALASAYRAKAVGPSAIAIDGALEERELGQVLALVVREGMIGETMAAVEAREALAQVHDPAVRKVLEQIARDETRHAELAWRFAAWAIETGGDPMREVVRSEIDLASVRGRGAEDPLPMEVDLRAHGLLSRATRTELHRQTLARVIAPCCRALVAPARLAERAFSGNQLSA